MEWRTAARLILQGSDPQATAQAAQALAQQALQQAEPSLAELDTQAALATPSGFPGLPERPRLVPPQGLPRRSLHTAEGKAALMHAVAHIEMNAIRLALDAAWRFAGMPTAYYQDWLRIAGEEALHFQLVCGWLAQRGHAYGDFDAHHGLWDMVERTRDDVTARMALVPRTLEARGLDATPPMQQRLAVAGEADAVAVLDVILRDEVGHVAVGNHWYRWLCERQGLDPVSHYAHLCRVHRAPRLRGPFNRDARRQAGFSDAEMLALEAADAEVSVGGRRADG
ncbi:MAG: ferritin-like domain-containing protein [Rubrivivax sp.]|jgi:uncharacterized ferritin-like protein (DUF455 family)